MFCVLCFVLVLVFVFVLVLVFVFVFVCVFQFVCGLYSKWSLWVILPHSKGVPPLCHPFPALFSCWMTCTASRMGRSGLKRPCSGGEAVQRGGVGLWEQLRKPTLGAGARPWTRSAV